MSGPGRLDRLSPSEIGAVVTFLEMDRRPEPAPIPESALRMERWDDEDLDSYRDLFRRVGARWLWFSRLAMDDATLRGHLGQVNVVVGPEGEAQGLLELDFKTPGECLIRFLGLVPELTGLGHGRWLFARTLDLAWTEGVKRVRVHTCTLDHPAALPSYLRAGFKVTGRALERFPDPRVTGLLPLDCAPQTPIAEGASVRSASWA